VQLTEAPVLIVSHASAYWDKHHSAQRGVNRLIAEAKKELIQIVYLRHPSPSVNQTDYFEDCQPTYSVGYDGYVGNRNHLLFPSVQNHPKIDDQGLQNDSQVFIVGKAFAACRRILRLGLLPGAAVKLDQNAAFAVRILDRGDASAPTRQFRAGIEGDSRISPAF
jgi:hypothetical protein